ncbi:MAG: hypothetical protein ABFS17_07570 [Chloroflexota bacterium]
MTARMLFFRLGILAATAALSLGYGLEQSWVGAVAAVVLGGFGWFGLKKAQSAWGADLFFGGVVLLVTVGVLLELLTYLLLIAILAGLGSWDLIRFQKRLAHSPESAGIAQVEKQHLGLLGLAVLIGGLLAVVGGIVRIQINFSLTLVLGIVLIVILSEVIRLLRN